MAAGTTGAPLNPPARSPPTPAPQGSAGTAGTALGSPPVASDGQVTSTEVDVRLSELGRSLDSLALRVGDLEHERVKILEFSFQSILVVLAILTLALGVPFTILYGGHLSQGIVENVIAGALVALVVLLVGWIVVWFWMIHKEVGRGSAGPPGGTGAVSAQNPEAPAKP